MRMIWLLVLGLVTAPMISADSQGIRDDLGERISVEASADRTSAMIGDLIRFSIIAEVPEEAEVEFRVSDQMNQWGGLDVREFGNIEVSKSGDKRKRVSQWFVLESLVPGSYIIPPHTVTVSEKNTEMKEILTQQIFINIRSALDDGDELELRDIEPTVLIERDWKWVYAAVFSLLLIAAGFAAARFLFFSDRVQKQATAEPEPAHILALRELKAMKNEGLIASGKVKEFFYRLSICLRLYIENRYEIRAAESSTEEFLEIAIKDGVFNGKTINELKEFFIFCDMVKFAKSDPSEDRCIRMLDFAEQFVQATRPEKEATEAEGVLK